MLLGLITLFISNELVLENYFIISFIGLISTMQIYAPSGTRPRWWVTLRVIVFLGYAIFTLIMYRRVSEIAVLF